MVYIAVLADVIFFSKVMLRLFNSRTRMASSPNRFARMIAPMALKKVPLMA